MTTGQLVALIAIVVILIILWQKYKQSSQSKANNSTAGQSTNKPAAVVIKPVVPNDQILANQQPKYLGCYKDTPTRALPKLLGHLTLPECVKRVRQSNNKIFGMQYNNGIGGDRAECWTGNDAGYARYGPANNCGSKKLGGTWANAIYKV